MAIKTETVTIDGTKYEMKRLGALEGRRVLARLGQVAGPALAELARTDGQGVESFAFAAAKLTEKLDPDTFDKICDIFMAQTRVFLKEDEAPWMTEAIFNDHFSGAYLKLLKWLGAHLQLNFPDFLGDSVSTKLRGAMVASVLQSQAGSIGSSGAS